MNAPDAIDAELPSEPASSSSPVRIDRLARACRALFWGTLLLVIDFRVDVDQFGIDLLPDWIGAPLVLYGAFALRGSTAVPFVRGAATLIGVMGAIDAVRTVAALGGWQIHGELLWIETLVSIGGMVATVFLCLAFIRLTRLLDWGDLTVSWNTSLFLVALLNVLPLGAAQTVTLFTQLGVDLSALSFVHSWTSSIPGLWSFAVLLTFIYIPLFHVLLSLGRTRRRAAGETAPPVASATPQGTNPSP